MYMIVAGKLIPDNFFDEQLEVEREFLDFARSLKEGGLDKLTVTKVSVIKSECYLKILSDNLAQSTAHVYQVFPGRKRVWGRREVLVRR